MTRKITDDEKKLWKHATKGVKGKAPRVDVDDFISRVPIKVSSLEDMLPPKPKTKKAPKELVVGKVNAMDGGSFRKLLQGHQKIEARIDLHGMWVSDAHIAVRDFIEMSAAAGKRCVLIITGKGGITGQGKIKMEFPKWLNDPDIRRMVLSFTQSRPEHGGAGAFYVYLRK